MSIVAGVDFGTLSVRVSIFDSVKGPARRRAPPIIRCSAKRKIPTTPRRAMPTTWRRSSLATRRAISERRRRWALHRGDRARHHRLQRDPRRCAACSRSTIIISGATIAPGKRRPKSPPPPTSRSSRRSTGAAASTPANGASPNCSTGCATIPRSAPDSPPRSSTATWSPPSSAASPTPRRFRAASAPWATSGCGTKRSAGCRRRTSSRSLDPALAGVREQLAGRYATSDQIAGHLTAAWAEKLGLRAGIPIPVGAFDAHWDAIGAGIRHRRRGQRGRHLHVHHGDQRAVRADSRGLRRGARDRSIPGTPASRPDSRRPAISSRRSRAARAPPSPTLSEGLDTTAPARPDCCASPGITAIARCWSIRN